MKNRLAVAAISLTTLVAAACGRHPAATYRPEEDLKAVTYWQSSWSPGRNQKEFGPYRVNADRAAVTLSHPGPWGIVPRS